MHALALHVTCAESCVHAHVYSEQRLQWSNTAKHRASAARVASSASLCTGFKLILSHCAFINLSLLPNFAPSSHWVAWPQILTTHNLRNFGGCSWNTGSDSRHWSRVESREEGKYRQRTSHTPSGTVKITVYTGQEILWRHTCKY